MTVLVTALFALQVNGVRIHVVTEAHHHGNATGDPQAPASESGSPAGDHEHDHHPPHAASDHDLQLAAKQCSPFGFTFLLLPEPSLILTLPDTRLASAWCVDGGRPGESPPDPAPPRAPPIA
jgi:hypothetical protein